MQKTYISYLDLWNKVEDLEKTNLELVENHRLLARRIKAERAEKSRLVWSIAIYEDALSRLPAEMRKAYLEKESEVIKEHEAEKRKA